MAYKTWGVVVEGVQTVDLTRTGADIWLGQFLRSSQAITIGSTNHQVRELSVIDYPNIGAYSIDVFTGKVRSPSATFSMTASPEVVAAFSKTATPLRDILANTTEYVDSTQTTIQFNQAIPSVPRLVYIGREAVIVQSLDSGTTYNVTRGAASTAPQQHRYGSAAYSKIPYWFGRRVFIYEITLPSVLTMPTTPTEVKAIWSGYLSDVPVLQKSTSTITFKAESSAELNYNRKINVNPLTIDGTEILTVKYSENGNVYVTSPPISGNRVSFDGNPNNQINEVTRVRKVLDIASASASNVVTTTDTRAWQIGESLVLSRGEVFFRPVSSIERSLFGLAYLGSEALPETYDPETGRHNPIEKSYELLVWSKTLDQRLSDVGQTISPTLACPYPYHPLTVALAFLMSSANIVNSNPATYDVLHPNWSLDVSEFIDLSVWEDLIERTAWMEIDQLFLGWDGQSFDIWKFITEELLPAFDLTLIVNRDGFIVPKEIQIADVELYYGSPIYNPLPETWDWQNVTFGAYSTFTANVGGLPWLEPETVTVQAETPARTVNLFFGKESARVFDWYFFSKNKAQSLGVGTLYNKLLFSASPIPQVTFKLDDTIPVEIADFVRLAKPDGLLTDILIDRDGNRVDDWATIPFVVFVTEVRRTIKTGVVECKGILLNYTVEALAKWRAPAVRIKSRVGDSEYLIEGTTSDFAAADSDALFMTVGDEVILFSSSLGEKNMTVKEIVAITPSGSDYIIEIDSDWLTVGTTNDWIIIADTPDYYNINVISSDAPYPYTAMTDGTTLTRPTGIDDPDIYA